MGYSEVTQNGDEGRSKFEKRKKTPKETMTGMGLYIFNPQKKTFLERSGKSWAKIGLFYLVFYACLALFWAACLYGFFSTIADDHPKLQNWDSLIKYNPGMGFRPQPEIEYTLINFNVGLNDSYVDYTESINDFLAKYGGADDNCDEAVAAEQNTTCPFSLSRLGDECTKDKHFGYDEGRPCVLLKMNKLFNWKPEPLGNDSYPDNVEPVEGFIPVTCEGVTDADKDNIGPVQFWPPGGFDTNFFPYTKQENYTAPLVMAQFGKLRVGTLVQVWCKVWADNIYHDRNDRAGSVGFEIMMD